MSDSLVLWRKRTLSKLGSVVLLIVVLLAQVSVGEVQRGGRARHYPRLDSIRARMRKPNQPKENIYEHVSRQTPPMFVLAGSPYYRRANLTMSGHGRIDKVLADVRSHEAYDLLQEQIRRDQPGDGFVVAGAATHVFPTTSIRALVRVRFTSKELANGTRTTSRSLTEQYLPQVEEDIRTGWRLQQDDLFNKDRRFRPLLSRPLWEHKQKGKLSDNACDRRVFEGLKDRIINVINTLLDYSLELTDDSKKEFGSSITFTRNLRIRLVHDVVVGTGVVSLGGKVPDVVAGLRRICTSPNVYLASIVLLNGHKGSKRLMQRMERDARKQRVRNARKLFMQFGYEKPLNITREYPMVYQNFILGCGNSVSRKWFYRLNGIKAPPAATRKDRISVFQLYDVLHARAYAAYAPFDQFMPHDEEDENPTQS